MPKATKLPSVSRERILEAASNRFLRNGYAATTLGSIASDSGITTPALYWHFSSKEELFSAALEEVLVSFVIHVRDSINATDPVLRLAQTVAAHVTWQLEQADVASAYAATVGMKALLIDLGEQHQTKFIELQRDYMRDLRSTLAEGRARGKFRYDDEAVTAYAIVTMCEYVHVWFNPYGPLTVSQVTRQIVELALRSAGMGWNAAAESCSATGPGALPEAIRG